MVLPECQELIDLAWTLGTGRRGMLLSRWASCWRDLKVACRRAGIPRCSAHDLRRTFAHWHLIAGCSFEDVARAMGHASTAMLFSVYGKIHPAAQRKRMVSSIIPYSLDASGTDALAPHPVDSEVPVDDDAPAAMTVAPSRPQRKR